MSLHAYSCVPCPVCARFRCWWTARACLGSSHICDTRTHNHSHKTLERTVFLVSGVVCVASPLPAGAMLGLLRRRGPPGAGCNACSVLLHHYTRMENQKKELFRQGRANRDTWERARQRRLRVRCALRCKPAAFRSAESFMLSSCPDCPRSSELINSACARKSDTTWEICPTLSSSPAADC